MDRLTLNRTIVYAANLNFQSQICNVSSYQVVSFIKYEYAIAPRKLQRFSIPTIYKIVVWSKYYINKLV